ncbi:VOC family protein [Prauserella flavalba]|uniref:VOC family protein n=1 Tax=Prauserella flavalba TaxID=1477506 RepID=UPI0036E517CF
MTAGVRRLDHVAVAVRDAETALALYAGVLGGRFVLGGDNDETGTRIIHLRLGGFKLELMQPLREDSLLARTIERRGEGFHHVTFVVGDVARTVDVVEAAGFETVGTELGNPTWRETFLRPRQTGGLVQLVDTDRDWSGPVDGITLDDVLAGRAGFDGAWPCWKATP